MNRTMLSWGLITDVGRVRKVNQDAVNANGSLFVVADGMGGHQGGEEASRIAVGAISMAESVDSIEELKETVITANRLIRAKGAAVPELVGMGTTVVAMCVLPAELTDGSLHLGAANVGDSRLYRFEDGTLEQVSLDHSLVGELERAGQITSAEAARHPQRNVVTRALGADDDVEVDTWTIPARVGQRYLLCSDGLVNEVSDEQIRKELETVADPAKAAANLCKAANLSGGRDNITILILDIHSDDSDSDDTASDDSASGDSASDDA